LTELCLWTWLVLWWVDFQFYSSRIASRGIILADYESAESYYGENARRSSSSRVYAASELSPSSTSGQSTSTLTRLKEKLSGFWLHMIQRWPTVHYSCWCFSFNTDQEVTTFSFAWFLQKCFSYLFFLLNYMEDTSY
jgi:hypothetical protein